MVGKIRPRMKYAANRVVTSWIRTYMFEQYPNLFLDDYVIEAIVNAYIDYIKHNLFQENEVSIISLGKFWVKKKLLDNGKDQYYPKFKASRHLILNLRQAKDSLTPAEVRSLEEKEKFIREVWERKQQKLREVKEADNPVKDVPLFLRSPISRTKKNT